MRRFDVVPGHALSRLSLLCTLLLDCKAAAQKARGAKDDANAAIEVDAEHVKKHAAVLQKLGVSTELCCIVRVMGRRLVCVPSFNVFSDVPLVHVVCWWTARLGLGERLDYKVLTGHTKKLGRVFLRLV